MAPAFDPDHAPRRRRVLPSLPLRFSAWSRDRTDDPFLFREVLYQLSYPSSYRVLVPAWNEFSSFCNSVEVGEPEPPYRRDMMGARYC